MNKQRVGKYIPLNAEETAVLKDTNTLLPKDEIYAPLAKWINEAVERAKRAQGTEFNELRTHNAVSLDGSRGTGKTAVLVNLKEYLKSEHSNLLNDVHILAPIDPTLLENGDSLFLHIIVASVLHDESIKNAQRENVDRAKELNHALDKIAHALEVVATSNQRHGLDKVRAMYGNKNLADTVHLFFQAVTKLLNKSLLVLPIDDVDTSLNLAFENLEIIRRYLTTPYVMPIVSGDRALYHEVTWRDFHSRLTKDSDHLKAEAYDTAIELADEYQRKVLPFPRRQTMPEVHTFWQWTYDRNSPEDKGITLGNKSDAMPLSNFISWLEIYLSGPINGREESRIPIQIPSLRSLTQFIKQCSPFIEELPNAVREAASALEVRRAWQMPGVPLKLIAEFHNEHANLGRESKRDYSHAYKLFAEKILKHTTEQSEKDTSRTIEPVIDTHLDRQITETLQEYFRFEPKAGAIYLVLQAKKDWKEWKQSEQRSRTSIFETPLFQPLIQSSHAYKSFSKKEDLSEWSEELKGRLPESWVTNLTEYKTILPYPVPEVGKMAPNASAFQKQIIEAFRKREGKDTNEAKTELKASFLIDLLIERNFYADAKQTTLLNIGRIFELIIASLTGDVKRTSIYSILTNTPFFSTKSLAPGRNLLLKSDEVKYEHIESNVIDEPHKEDPHSEIISELESEIRGWRNENSVESLDISPWLVYKVFEKVYRQATNRDKYRNNIESVRASLNIAAHTFYLTWSAFGSFEKGELFGLPNIVSTTSLNDNKLLNFEQHDQFFINLSPFGLLKNNTTTAYRNRRIFGRHTRTVTHVLGSHPLKLWLDEVIGVEWSKPTEFRQRNRQKVTSKEWLCKELDIDIPKTLTKNFITHELKKLDSTQIGRIKSEINNRYNENDNTVKNVNKVIDHLNNEPK